MFTQLISHADETKVVLHDYTKLGVDIIQIISHCSNARTKIGNLQISSSPPPKKNPRLHILTTKQEPLLSASFNLLLRPGPDLNIQITLDFSVRTLHTYGFDFLSAGTNVITHKILLAGYKGFFF